jgi:hypothetical protein
MPAPASPQFRFLLRGSALFIVLLALWWWVLLGPMLAGLRVSTSVALWLLPGGRTASGVTIAPDGGWILRVPMPGFVARQDAVQKAYGRAPGAPPVNVRSFRLAIARRIPTFFTLSFPLFWALVLAGQQTRLWWRPLAVGTALLAILAQLQLLVYAVYSIQSTLHLAEADPAKTIWYAVEYLNVNVVPYAAPILIAPWLHPGLRAQIFPWGEAPETAPVPPAEADKPGRKRLRGPK